MYVVFLYGFPATGKYTIGRIVAEELGIPLFHNHLTVDLVGTLFEFGTDEFVSMREEVWINAFRTAAESGQSFVFTFNPENTVDQATIDKMRTAVEGSGGRIFFVELVCDEREIENRIVMSSREGFGKLTDLDLYRKLKQDGAFDSPVLPDSFAQIDTTMRRPSDSAALIVRAVRNRVAGS